MATGSIDLSTLERPVFAYTRLNANGEKVNVVIDLYELGERLNALRVPNIEGTNREDYAVMYEKLREIFEAPTQKEVKEQEGQGVKINTLERHHLEHMLATAQEMFAKLPDRKRFFDALRQQHESSRV